MRWEEIKKLECPIGNVLKGKNLKIFLAILFSGAFFGTRLPRLANDVINPDGVNWHYRAEQFVVGLKFNQLEKTYQHYHPGVSLMWITGPAVEIYKQISGTKVYDMNSFQSFDLVAKLALVLVQYGLSLLVIFSLSKLTGFFKSFLIVLLFSFEPFFLGNSRLYHMDILVTLFLFLSLVYAFKNLKKPSVKTSLITGLFLSLSFLTKSVSIGALVFVLLYSVFYFVVKKEPKKILSTVLVTLASFVLFTFLLFPALWKDPVYFLGEIFREAERVGIRKGHEQIIFGEYTNEAGVMFYPVVILIKTSPMILVSALAGVCYYFSNLVKTKDLFKKFKEGFSGFGLFLTVFYIGYVLAMSFPTKKIDRYMLVVFPYLAYLSAVGFRTAFYKLKKIGKERVFDISIIFLAMVFWIWPICKIFPYYFTYASPLVGGPKKANTIIGQKSFGVGVPELKETILKRYQKYYLDYPSLGFYDTKPMSAIYPNSKIFDVRVYGPGSYDILVLAINEEIPQEVLDSDKYVFEKDGSIFINGLEYWKIYVKKELRGAYDE